MAEEIKPLKIPELASFYSKNLLYFLFLLSFCGSPPSFRNYPEKKGGVLFPTHRVQNNVGSFSRVVHFLTNFFTTEEDVQVSLETFFIHVDFSEVPEPNPKEILKTKLLVDTGSDETILKKIYFKKQGIALHSPIHTANDRIEEKFEIHTRFLSPSDAWKNLGKARFLVTSRIDPLPVDGILGNRFFSKYVVWFDFEKEMRLFSPTEWVNQDISGMEEVSSIEEVFTHWVFPVQIQNKKYNFIFDTGADYTIFTEELAKELPSLPNQELKYMEFSGKVYTSKIYKSPKICLSRKICSEEVIGLSSPSLHNFFRNDIIKVDGILGMNFIKDYRTYLHYPKRKMYIQKK